MKKSDLKPSLFPKCPSKTKWTLNKNCYNKQFVLTNAHPYQKGYFHAYVQKHETNTYWWKGTLEVHGKLFIQGMWKTKREAQKDIKDMAMKYVVEITQELDEEINRT